MIRFIVISFLIVCLSPSVMSQDLVLSEAVPLRNEIAYYIVGKIKDKHLVLRERPGKFMLNAYNADMTLGWERELELPKRRPEIVDVWDYDDRFYILFVHRIKGQSQLRMHKYDGGANLVDSTLVKNLGNQFLKPDFSIIQSENRKMLQIEEINGSTNRELMVFNLESMELLYETNFSPAQFNPNSDYEQLLVDNEGSSYYIIERHNRKSKKKTHHFAVFAHESYSDRKYNFQIRMSGRLTYDVLFTFDNLNHALVGAGYYMNKSYSRALGTFYIKTPIGDPTSSVRTFTAFDNTLLETVEGRNKKQKKYLSEIRVKDLIVRRDGGVLIVGEKFKRLDAQFIPGVENGPNSNFGNSINPFASDFFFDDIFIVSHHPDGALHWTNFFYKRQYSKNDSGIFSSYFVMKTPSQLRFLFNDEIVQNTTVSTYNVLPDGSYDRKALLNANFQNIKLRFVSSKQVSANEVVVPSEYKSELRLLKVLF